VVYWYSGIELLCFHFPTGDSVFPKLQISRIQFKFLPIIIFDLST
jgi:hypothetical protein